MADGTLLEKWANRISEAMVIALVCLAPWAFGAVEAWAELMIDAGIGLVAVLQVFNNRRSNDVSRLSAAPGLALLGLSVLALAQAASLSGPSAAIANSIHLTESDLSPKRAERILGDSSSPVASPSQTISLNPEESVNIAVRLAAAWVLFQCVLGMGGGFAAYRRFAAATAANAAIMALFSLVQAATWNGKVFWLRACPVADGWRSGGPFVCHNHLAAYLNIGLGMSWGFLLGSECWRRGPGGLGVRCWSAYAVGLTLVGVISSHSRSGFLAMLTAIIVTTLMLRTRIRRVGVGLVVATAMVVVLLVVSGTSSPFRRLASIENASSYEDRIAIWRASVQAWISKPILGSGLGSFATAVAPWFRVDDGIVYARAENEYLDLLVEGGVIGFGIALVGVITAAWSGFRSFQGAGSPRDEALIAGGLFGLSALAIQSLGDFSPHIPGVALTAVVLSAHLYNLRRIDRLRRSVKSAVEARRYWVCGSMIFAIFLMAMHVFYLARAESRLAGSGIPPPGSFSPGGAVRGVPKSILERRRKSLESALADRPDWAEGHLRLGLIHLSLYEQSVVDWIGETLNDAERSARLADPLWLHAVVHSHAGREDRIRFVERKVVEQEPVRRHLIPATRCFLEARRCSPALASIHARLASLDYLLIGKESASVYGNRAVRLAGSDRRTLELTALATAQAGDLELAARAWRRCLVARPSEWQVVADEASNFLSPARILAEVAPKGGRFLILFSDHLYSAPTNRDARVLFLKEALRRLPSDPELTTGDRFHLEAIAHARLKDPRTARDCWEKAMRMEPQQTIWRREYAEWLMSEGDFDTAYRQAVTGVQLDPDDPALRETLATAADALARGDDGLPQNQATENR